MARRLARGADWRYFWVMPLRSCSASPAARFALTATVAFLLATLFGPWWFGTDPVQLAGWCLIGGITVALGLWEQRKD